MKDFTGKKVIDSITELFQESYRIGIYKLNANDFNVPQNRRRIIIISIRRDLNIEPTEPIINSSIRPTIRGLLEENVDSSYYLSQKAIDGIANKKEQSKLKGNGFGAQFLDLDKASYTIPARYWKDGYDALVKYSDRSIRRLTITELRRIQTFPEDYTIT